MIKVYFESKGTSEIVATFESENIYLSCLPIMEMIASENNQIVIESTEEETTTKKAIYWSTEDFKGVADRLFCELQQDHPKEFEKFTSWEQFYDKSKFPQELEKMISQHDANIGITWQTIENHVGNCEIKNQL